LLITILNSLGVGKPFPAVTDQYLSPVEVSEVCQVITEILDKNLQGILHFASEELISPYQMANAVAEHFLLDKSLIEPVSLGSFFGKKKASLRLKYSSFKSIESLGKISIKASSFATYLKLDHFKKITF
jgi:dTDP-4-dehydrorhamnose reductase